MKTLSTFRTNLIIFLSINCICFFMFCIGLLGLLNKVISTYWIKYGNGQIVIQRISKDMVIGGQGGKWRSRRDVIMLQEIELYGPSVQLLGKNVEWPLGGGGGLSYEYFFQLKDGRRIGFDGSYYTRRQKAELFRYIYDTTGIEMTLQTT